MVFEKPRRTDRGDDKKAGRAGKTWENRWIGQGGGRMARKTRAKPKKTEQPALGAAHCLDPFLSLGEVGPQEGAAVVRTRRGRMDSANAGKKAELAFAQGRLAQEAQLMADFAFDMWEREGRIPALCSTLKFKNIPPLRPRAGAVGAGLLGRPGLDLEPG